jgi:hypothetical protein
MWNKKINPLEFIILIILISFSWFFLSHVNGEHKEKENKHKSLQKEYADIEKSIAEKGIYLRLKDYGYKLSLIDNLLKYKDSQVNWYEFFVDFSYVIPTDTTIKSVEYTDSTEEINIDAVWPKKERILQTMRELNSFDGLTNLNFNSINKEPITFKNDRTEYKWYGSKLTMEVDRDYLDARYKDIRKFKDIKYSLWDRENVKEIEGNASNVFTGSIVETLLQEEEEILMEDNIIE